MFIIWNKFRRGHSIEQIGVEVHLTMPADVDQHGWRSSGADADGGQEWAEHWGHMPATGCPGRFYVANGWHIYGPTARRPVMVRGQHREVISALGSQREAASWALTRVKDPNLFITKNYDSMEEAEAELGAKDPNWDTTKKEESK